jgi:tetrahydromethanopterin S-methyltransferase subunit G
MSEFKQIMDEIKKIHKRLDAIEKSNENMDKHIHFIHKTYDLVRGPLSWVKNKVEYMAGRSQYEELPPIEKDNSIQ